MFSQRTPAPAIETILHRTLLARPPGGNRITYRDRSAALRCAGPLCCAEASDLDQAEAQHRGHAILEQINADLIDGPLAHLPSGHFWANSAWLACAAIAQNLTRAAGHLAAPHYATARTATIRREIINVAARLAHRARTIHLHLPQYWPWQYAFTHLFTAVHAPPA